MKKPFLKTIYDFILCPLRLVLLPDAAGERLGLTSLWQERLNNVLPHIEGKLLDIGCGQNRLVKSYPGEAVGVDVYDWGSGAVIIESSASLPFADASFDTVTFLACFNHIPEREEAVAESARVLRDGGRVVLTMIDPVIGYIGHKIWWYGEERERGLAEGEKYGLWNSELISVFEKNGFALEKHARFVYWMNNLFVFKKL